MGDTIPLLHLVYEADNLTQAFANDTANNGTVTLYTVAANKIAYLCELVFAGRNSDTVVRSMSLYIYDATPTELVEYKVRIPPNDAVALVIPLNPPLKLLEGYTITVVSPNEFVFIDTAARFLVADE